VLQRYVIGLRNKADQAGNVRINPEAIAYSNAEETAQL
jgi:hypothetical protein